MCLPNLNRVVPQRQRGAFGLMAVGVMFLLVICVVVALDSGRLYMQKQNVQRVADMAALDAVAGLNFSSKDSSDDPQVLAEQDDPQVLAEQDDPQVLAEQNAVENNFQPMEGERRIETAMGTIEVDEGINRFNKDKPGSALRVRAWHRVPTSLVGNLARLMPNTDIESHVWLMGEAVAQQRQFVAFTAGSSLLTADLSSSPLLKPVLQRLLESEVDVDVVSAGGLANLGISLLSLIDAHPDIGTVDQLLSTPLSIGGDDGLANLMLQALQSSAEEEEILTVTEDALGELARVSLGTIKLADILTVNTPDSSRESALETLVSVGDLLNAGIFLANKGSAVNLDGVKVDVGSLVTVDLDLSIVEPPQLAVGPPGCIDWSDPPCNSPVDAKYWLTQASTAQLDLGLKLSLDLIGLLTLSVDLDVDGASADVGAEVVKKEDSENFNVKVGGFSGLLGVDTNVSLELLPDFIGLLKLEVGGDTSAKNEVSGSPYMSDWVKWPGSKSNPPSTTLKSEATHGVTNILDEVLSNLNVNIVLGPDAEDDADSDCPLWDLLCHVGNVIDSLFNMLGPVFNTVNSLLGFAVDDLLGLTDALGQILGGVVGDVLGPPLLDPLLSALGISAAEVEVEIIDVDTSGAELVL